jgi:receptor expression-enhancing protein 1/2/3/4
MVSAILSRFVILVFGTLYPAYASYKAIKTKNIKEYVKWMMYWIVFALFTAAETFADIFICWIPFYYEMKILFVLWLISPATKGASILYRKFIHPKLSKHEPEIDKYISKASDQGYSAFLSLGSRGFNAATNFVLTSAMKGQTTIVEHIKKSYSLNDLTDETDNATFSAQRREELAEFTDDEIEEMRDNRLIEESYQEEMMEKEKPRAKERKKRVKAKDADSILDDSRRANPSYSHKDPPGESHIDGVKVTHRPVAPKLTPVSTGSVPGTPTSNQSKPEMSPWRLRRSFLNSAGK